MSTSSRLGLWLLCGNVALTGYGVASLVLCNVGPTSCWPFVAYAYAAFWLGVPLFLVTTALAPPGTFAAATPAARTYRRLYYANLGVASLIWGVPLLLLWAGRI